MTPWTDASETDVERLSPATSESRVASDDERLTPEASVTWVDSEARARNIDAAAHGELYGARFALEAVKRGQRKAAAKAGKLRSRFSRRVSAQEQPGTGRRKARATERGRAVRWKRFWRKALASRTWVMSPISTARRRWDVLSVMMTMYTGLITPVQVCFLSDSAYSVDSVLPLAPARRFSA